MADRYGDAMAEAEVVIPKWNQLFGPTIEALKALGGSGTIREIVDKVVEQQQFSEDQLSVPHGDSEKSEIEYRLAWARTNLKNLGAVENSVRGVWSLTEYGRKTSESELVERDREWRRELAAKRNDRQGSQAAGEGVDGDELPEELEELDWKRQLLGRLIAMSPDGFERLAQRLLREAGFVNVTVTGKSGDGGIDGVGVYRLSLVSFQTFFQCKRYQGKVAPAAVRDFRGAMAGRGDKGLLITTGSFTKEAQNEATRDGAPPIELIDGDQLCELLKQYDLGVRTVERVEEDVLVLTEFFDDI